MDGAVLLRITPRRKQSKHPPEFSGECALSCESPRPVTAEEKQFVEVCRGIREPATEAERVWSKYMTRIKRPKRFHTLSGGKPQMEGMDDFVETDD